MWKTRIGFTLIEIIIVVGLVAVLSAGVISIIGRGPSEYSRDTRRQADLQTFSAALELYRNDNGTYPPCVAPAAQTCQALSSRIAALASGYLSSSNWPTDPISGRYYRYMPLSSTNGQCDGSATKCTTYTICASSEKGGTSQNSPCGGACGTSSSCVFVVTNP